MKRRNFLKLLSVGSVATIGARFIWESQPQALSPVYEDMHASPVDMIEMIQYMSTPAPDAAKLLKLFQNRNTLLASENRVVKKPDKLNDYLRKMENFEHPNQEDILLKEAQYTLLVNTFKRLDRIQNLVGYGNFNVISFDDMRKFAKRYASVGEFQSTELAFLAEIFSENASRYGFLGEKVTTELTTAIPRKDRLKVPHTGHYLFKGESDKLYRKLKDDLDGKIVLTSGIRSIVKQSYLFLAKTIQSKGNLSLASRSLAPPGHSFHGVGDFDVGKIGYGLKNFTIDFAKTDEFKKLVDLGYVDMRYPRDNLVGVRYEPWHIKVV